MTNDAKCRAEQRHQWDADGERCVKCGDKDWMAGPVCHGRIESPAEQVLPANVENTSGAPVEGSQTPAPAAGPSAVEEAKKMATDWCNHYPILRVSNFVEQHIRHAEELDRLRAENERLKAEVAVLRSCKEEQDAGNGPCGVCVVCLRERAERAEAALRGGVVVPEEPTEEMLDAPRQIILYSETPGRSMQGLREHLDLAGVEYGKFFPEWGMQATGHLTKGGIAALVWAAMLAAAKERRNG